MNKEKKEVVKVNQITEGVIWQQILIFFLPILFGTFFQQLYNTADAMIVGHFLGKQALAAVGGTTGTLINLLVGFFVGLSSGATVVISQHYGANKEDKVQWAVHTSIAFSILGGIVLTVVGIGCSRWMLDLMNTPDDVVNYALIYMRVYFLGTIGNLIYNMGSGILRAVGDSKRPLLYLIICCMTNIALDFLFVVGLQMGVMGAALATILSQIISAVLVMGSLMRTRDIYRLHLRKISIDWINDSLITFVKDRLGHDQRYAIDPTKITNALGWYPETKFEVGIVKTIEWYLNNQPWVEEVTSGDYQKYYEQMYGGRG